MENYAGKIVNDHVYACASSLVSGLMEISNYTESRVFEDALCISQDELMQLCQREDFETPVKEFIMSDADVVDLECIADSNGYWSDVKDNLVPEVTENEEGVYFFDGCTPGGYDDEDDANEAAIESVMLKLREAVWAMTFNYEEVCREHCLDTEYTEVLEHWIVSSWLKDRLESKGEVVGNVAGLDIWGRCTSGQAIYMDEVIQSCAAETYKAVEHIHSMAPEGKESENG